MTAKTPADRQRDFKEARRAAGLKQVHNLWCHPEDEPAIRNYAAKLQRKRERIDKAKEPQ